MFGIKNISRVTLTLFRHYNGFSIFYCVVELIEKARTAFTVKYHPQLLLTAAELEVIFALRPRETIIYPFHLSY